MGFLLASAIALGLLDQSLKRLAERLAESSDSSRQRTGFGLIYRRNPDGGFKALSSTAGGALLLIAALCMSLVLGLSGWSSPMAFGFGLALGGASSNLWDRSSRGFVVDYISLVDNLAINVGDIGIALGSVLALGTFLASPLV